MKTKENLIRLGLIPTLIILLLLVHIPVHAAPAPQGGDSSYSVGACRNVDRANLRAEIEQAALGVLTDNGSNLDVEALVARKWAELDVDAVINAEVARAVAALSNQEGYLDRLWSGWSAEKAEEYAGRVAEDAFRSPAFTAKLEEVAQAIGAEIARVMDAQFTQAASVAFLCLQEYVGEAYSTVLFQAFQSVVGAQVQEMQVAISPAELNLSAITAHTAGLTGVSIIVITEVTRRVSQKIGEKLAQRIAGKVIGRVVGRAGSSFIPLIGWAVGIGLIAWDLYEGGKGSLPQIEEALTGEEVKERIRGEIADAVAASLPEETSIVSLEIAVTLIEAWDAFCAERVELCRLAAESPGFRNLLDSTPLTALDRLDALVNIFVNEIGRSQLNRAVETGALDTLLTQPEATALLTTTHSLTDTLAWMTVADDNLAQVVALGVAEQAQPDELDAASLHALLALADAAAVTQILALEPAETAALLTLPNVALQHFVATYSTDELRQLAAYLVNHDDAGATVSSRQVISDLVSNRVTLAQLQAPPTPIAMLTPTPTLSLVASATAQPSDNAGDDPQWLLPVLLLTIIIGAAGGLVVWQRRTIAARQPGDKIEVEKQKTKT